MTRRVYTAVVKKRCNKCATVKALDAFPLNRTSKDGRGYWCKPCNVGYMVGRRAGYKPEDKQAISSRRKKTRVAARENARCKHYREENRPAVRARAAARLKQSVAALHDSYIRNRLAQEMGVSKRVIPNELVEAKRQHMFIRRALKGAST